MKTARGYSEEQLEIAIRKVKENGMPVRTAAKQCGVSYFLLFQINML